MDKCPYCGNNPISHSANWFYTSLDIILTPLRKKLFFSWFGRIIIDRMASSLAMAIFYILKFLGLIEVNRDIGKIKFARAKTLWQEALHQKIEFSEIKPLGISIDLYKAPVHGKPTMFFGLPRPADIDESILDWIDDKLVLKQTLAKAGLPIPKGDSFLTYDAALKFFKTLSKPVVVKPRKGSRGRHTITFVSNKEQFKNAFQVAKQLCAYVLVEEQLSGDVFRGTVVGGNLVGILGGSSPRVIGNGVDTIANLIATHNQNLPPGMKPIIVSEATASYLMRQDLNLNSVLAKDKTITLSEKIGVAYGGTSYDCTDAAHPDNKEIFIHAALAVGDPILGFDFIIPDITQSYKTQRAGIIECNGAPFLHLHNDPLIGKTRNAAKHVWDLVK